MDRRRAGLVSVLLAGAGAIAWLLSSGAPSPRASSEGREDPRASAAPDAVGLEGRARSRPEAPDAAAAKADTPAAATAAVAWSVAGTVRDPAGVAVAGAGILVTEELGDALRSLATTATGPDGAYRVGVLPFPGASAAEQGMVSVRVEAVAAGFLSAVGRSDAPAGGEGAEVRVDLSLTPGASVRGRVLDRDGAPVPWADVALCPVAEGARADTRTDARGRYAFPVEGAGERVVFATHDGEGTARVRVTLVPARDAEVADLVLRGDGVLSGKAVHPDGTPAPLLVLEVTPSESDVTPTDGGCAGGADGTTRAGVRTRLDGTFSLRGLRPGRYRVAALLDPKPGVADHATGETDLVVPCPYPRVVLRVRDAQGRPVRGASYDIAGTDGETSFSGSGTATGADASADFQVTPGMRIRASGEAGALASETLLLEIAPDRAETEAILTLRPVASWARARVVVTGPDGAALPAYHVEIQPVVTGLRVIPTYEFDGEDGGLSPALRPGPYEVRVWPGRTTDRRTDLPYVPVTTTLTLPAGVETKVAVRARLGGRLRLTLRVPEGASLDTGALAIEMRPADGTAAIPLSPSTFLWEGAPVGSRGRIEPGRPATCLEAVEAGRYTLRVEAEGLRPFESLVEIEAGKPTDAEVRLEAR